MGARGCGTAPLLLLLRAQAVGPLENVLTRRSTKGKQVTCDCVYVVTVVVVVVVCEDGAGDGVQA